MYWFTLPSRGSGAAILHNEVCDSRSRREMSMPYWCVDDAIRGLQAWLTANAMDGILLDFHDCCRQPDVERERRALFWTSNFEPSLGPANQPGVVCSICLSPAPSLS